MPDTALPKLEKWLPTLQKLAEPPDKNLFLVGHSAGVITILRYLETLSGPQTIGGVVMVAGFTDDLGYKELTNFFDKPIDFERIKRHCQKFVDIYSDTDPYVGIKYATEFEEKLQAKLIFKPKMGHFSGPVDNETSCTSLPEVAESVIEQAQS